LRRDLLFLSNRLENENTQSGRRMIVQSDKILWYTRRWSRSANRGRVDLIETRYRWSAVLLGLRTPQLAMPSFSTRKPGRPRVQPGNTPLICGRPG